MQSGLGSGILSESRFLDTFNDMRFMDSPSWVEKTTTKTSEITEDRFVLKRETVYIGKIFKIHYTYYFNVKLIIIIMYIPFKHFGLVFFMFLQNTIKTVIL